MNPCDSKRHLYTRKKNKNNVDTPTETFTHFFHKFLFFESNEKEKKKISEKFYKSK